MLAGLIVHPILPYALVAAAMTACLALFLSFKSEITAVRRTSRKSGEDVLGQLREMESAMGQLREKVEEIGEPAAAAMRPGLNLTRRAQAIRMHYRGESAATIAAALQTPRNEIELLLKLHKHQQPEKV